MVLHRQRQAEPKRAQPHVEPGVERAEEAAELRDRRLGVAHQRNSLAIQLERTAGS